MLKKVKAHMIKQTIKIFRVTVVVIFLGGVIFVFYSIIHRSQLINASNQCHQVIWEILTRQKQKDPFPDKNSVEVLVRSETDGIMNRMGKKKQVQFELKKWDKSGIKYVIRWAGGDGILNTKDDHEDEFGLGEYPFSQ